ncbi:flagellar basal-body rod protein FlgG [Paracoccus ravus]|uniref:flagellar basal-body rod protein FlgG n=1 Tax=Paracoccus ravus TaxID=2447760 RepID=UPI00106E6DC7|nr:flagellar basal-body rod protein FlgG [Paracoccus ravus]
MKALGTSATGMLAQQRNVDVIANNIANANTTGFKAGRAVFSDLVYQTMSREGEITSNAGTMTPVAMDIGLGVRSTGVMRLAEQGGLSETGNDLDLAIDGKGFFVVNRPDGTVAYTRAGNFGRSAEGEIVTHDGFQLDPGIVIPEGTREISISATGFVSAYVGNETEAEVLGQVTLATFVNEAGLKSIGDNLLLETEASGDPILGVAGDEGFGVMIQRYVEASNVDTVAQMTALIMAQRTYEMNSKTMTAADQMLQTANQIR